MEIVNFVFGMLLLSLGVLHILIFLDDIRSKYYDWTFIHGLGGLTGICLGFSLLYFGI